MTTTLIITTYNWKEALDLVFCSIARQAELPDEVVVADDGSRPDTAELVAQWAAKLPVPVWHIWQEDVGFRLARSRNRAIAASRGDYLIIIDGDMVLHRDFIRDHKRAALPGYFIQGVRLFAGPEASQKVLREQKLDLGFFASGIKRRRHAIHNRLLSWLVLQRIRTDQKAIRGSNQAFWRKDLLLVNGFDERMSGWGREDNEIVARLYHSGIKRRNLKFAGLTTHLFHKQRKPEGENPNDRYLRETIDKRLVRCEHGLAQHLAEFTKHQTGSSDAE